MRNGVDTTGTAAVPEALREHQGYSYEPKDDDADVMTRPHQTPRLRVTHRRNRLHVASGSA